MGDDSEDRFVGLDAVLKSLKELEDKTKSLVDASIDELVTENEVLKAENKRLRKEIDEIQEARTLTTEIPESWGWSDCFFCGEPIMDEVNHDTFLSKSIHKKCRGQLIDGLNASQREKEDKKDDST